MFPISIFNFSVVPSLFFHFISKYTKSMNWLNPTHMTVEDDGPYESQDDGRSSVYDVRDVYVHQFNLVKQNRKTWNKVKTESPCFAVLSQQTHRLPLEEAQGRLDVGSLLKNAATPLPLLRRDTATPPLQIVTHFHLSSVTNGPSHHRLAAHHFQQVEKLRAVSQVREDVRHKCRRISL